MQTEILDDTKVLYSPRTRSILIVISALLVICCLFILISIQTNSAKILTLYVLTICIMHLIVSYKNYLNKYEIGIFCFLCLQLITLAPKFGNMDGLVATSYLLSYRYGISSRSLVATFIDIITNGGFITKNLVWHFIFCSTVFLSFLISVYMGFAAQKSSDTIKIFVLFLSLLYLSCFTAPSAYFVHANFGRVEIFAFIFMLILMAVIDKPAIRWIIPLLALLTVSTHLILVFFYIPFVFIMLLYNLLNKEKIQKSSVLLFATTVSIVAAGLFLYILFHERTFVFQNARTFSEHLKTKSDLGFSEEWIHMTLFAKLQDHLDGWFNEVTLQFSGNLSVIINIPLIILFVTFWTKCLVQEEKKTAKLFFALPSLALLYQAAAFFMFVDFGRWMIMVLNVQFMLVFYVLYKRNKTALFIVQKIVPHIKRYWFIIILACFFMSFLGTVSQTGPSDKVMGITNGLLLLLNQVR